MITLTRRLIEQLSDRIGIEMTDIYHPKGSMCINCQNRMRHCEFLDFHSMPVILEKYTENGIGDRFLAVKCTEFLAKDRCKDIKNDNN